MILMFNGSDLSRTVMASIIGFDIYGPNCNMVIVSTYVLISVIIVIAYGVYQ